MYSRVQTRQSTCRSLSEVTALKIQNWEWNPILPNPKSRRVRVHSYGNTERGWYARCGDSRQVGCSARPDGRNRIWTVRPRLILTGKPRAVSRVRTTLRSRSLATPSLSCLALEVSTHPGRLHLDQT